VATAGGSFDNGRLPDRLVVHQPAAPSVTQVDPFPRSADRPDDGATITFRFPGSSERISVQLNADRMPALWIVWLAIAMLLMALWLPGGSRRAARP
jgi:hypothetical protein